MFARVSTLYRYALLMRHLVLTLTYGRVHYSSCIDDRSLEVDLIYKCNELYVHI
jgi:hypothetical protein